MKGGDIVGKLKPPNNDDLEFDKWISEQLKRLGAKDMQMVGIIDQKAYQRMEISIKNVIQTIRSASEKNEFENEESGVRVKIVPPKRFCGSFGLMIWMPCYGVEFSEKEFSFLADSLPENTTITFLPASVTDEVLIEICYKNIITPIT